MAKEKNLTAVTSVAAADFARVVTSAGASVKATFANVAKYIIETYNGSTVAGSAQSVKSALDSLNSNSERINWSKTTDVPLSNCSKYNDIGVAYAVIGNLCHVYISVSNLTANSRVKIATLPEGARPLAVIQYLGGAGLSYTNKSYFTFGGDGAIYVISDDTYAMGYTNFIVKL